MTENELALRPQVVETPPQRVAAAFDIVRYDGMRSIATEMSKSDLIPKVYHGKPADVLLAMTKLDTLGLNPVAALSGTYVIGNRVSLWGETWLAVIQSAPGYAGMSESWDATTKTATTTFRRVIMGTVQSLTKSFSMEDAKTAKLAGKDTYGNFPQDMLTWRARTRAGALFADVMQGMVPAEVAGDYTVELDARPEPVAVPVDTQEAKKLAEAGPRKVSVVLAGTTLERESKPDARAPWKLWKITAVEGGPFYTKEPAVAAVAQNLEGKAAVVTFNSPRPDMLEAVALEAVAE